MSSDNNNILAYHFVNTALRDGAPVPPDGETLVFEGSIELCARGYHASRKPWQALEYALGHTLCRVHCAGQVIEDFDKLVCTERTIISRINAEKLLFEFARSCARDVLHLWDAPDVVVEFLETGNKDLRDAARDAALGAFLEAAVVSVLEAAGAVARNAARNAAWAATWGDNCEVARRVAQKKQRDRFTSMVNAEFDKQ